MKVIGWGQSLLFAEEPPTAYCANSQHQAFGSNEIQRLLETSCICEVERDETHIINPLTLNRPDFSESGKAGADGFRPTCVTYLFEGQ